MSWLRVEGRMPQHKKIAPLTDSAFRLHVTALCWCVEEETDGKVPSDIPPALPAAPRGKALSAAIGDLLKRGIWEIADDGSYIVHDFLDYNMSAAEAADLRARRAAAGAVGGRRSAQAKAAAKEKPPDSKTQASAQAPGQASAAASAQANGKQNSTPIPTPITEGTQKDHPKTSQVARGNTSQPGDDDGESLLIPCPPGLRLTDAQVGTLAIQGSEIPPEVIADQTLRFVTKSVAEPSDRRTLEKWQKSLASAVVNGWREDRDRKRKLASTEPKSGTRANGAYEDTGELERALAVAGRTT